MAEAITWKIEPITSDIERYRYERLDYLERNLPNFELNTLIELENQSYDESNTKEEYENHISTLVKMLKEAPKNENENEEPAAIILPSTTPPIPTIQVLPSAPIDPLPQQEPISIVIPSAPEYTTIINENQNDRYKKEIESARLRQEIELNQTIANYFTKEISNDSKSKSKPNSNTVIIPASTSSSTNSKNLTKTTVNNNKNTINSNQKKENKTITFPKSIQKHISSSSSSSGSSSSRKKINTIFDQEKSYCEWNFGRRG